MKLQTCKRCRGTGKEIDQVALGECMRKERVKADLSLREMGARLGVSHAYIWDMETGRRSWSDRVRKKFLEALK